MITGKTTLIAHIGYPTKSFKAPMIYNPWFEAKGIDAVVIPLGVKGEDFAEVLRPLFRSTNLHGALITMPNKVTTIDLVDELSITARIAGAANAILKRSDGSLLADMFDGSGFVRGVVRKGRQVAGASALIVGSGGVGSAIAASLAAAGVARLGVYDARAASAEALGARLAQHYPSLKLGIGSANPEGYDIVVNATPLGMNEGDLLPIDIAAIAPSTFVGEVVMKEEFTPLLRAAKAKGCEVQVGTDMLYEMIPAYLEFFGFGGSDPDELRRLSKLQY
jgi:shikimate dehydrogenase